MNNGKQRHGQEGQHHHEHGAELTVDHKAHDHGADQRQRSAHHNTQDHLEGVLHVGHIGGHTGDKARG